MKVTSIFLILLFLICYVNAKEKIDPAKRSCGIGLYIDNHTQSYSLNYYQRCKGNHLGSISLFYSFVYPNTYKGSKFFGSTISYYPFKSYYRKITFRPFVAVGYLYEEIFYPPIPKIELDQKIILNGGLVLIGSQLAINFNKHFQVGLNYELGPVMGVEKVPTCQQVQGIIYDCSDSGKKSYKGGFRFCQIILNYSFK